MNQVRVSGSSGIADTFRVSVRRESLPPRPFPKGKGSTVGSYVLYQLKKNGHAPAAIVNRETETIIATGCILAEIPLVDRLGSDPLEVIHSGDRVRVDGREGRVIVG